MVTRQQQAQHAAPCNLNFGRQVSPQALRYLRTPTPWIVDRSLQTNGARILIFGDETTGSVGLEQDMNHLSRFVFGLLVVFIPCSWGYPEVSLISHLPKFDQIVQFFVDELRRQWIHRTDFHLFLLPAFFLFQVDCQDSFVSKNDCFEPKFPSKCF